MKVIIYKAIIALCIGIALGLFCYEFAIEEGSRNLISFVTTTLSVFFCLGSAIGISYKCGHRNVNIKVSSWFITILVILTNFIFSYFTYNVVVYLSLVFLLVIIDLAIILMLYKPQ